MKETVLRYGIISGVMIVSLGALGFILMTTDGKLDMDMGKVYGYANMLISLSMVFFGIRHYRDRYLAGKISFKSALWTGFLIACIASVFYVTAWMIYYAQPGVPENFEAQYIEHLKTGWVAEGKSEAEMTQMIDAQKSNWEMYNNNALVRILFTFVEILPLGFVISVISALILKRK
jgi:hypothetical protein